MAEAASFTRPFRPVPTNALRAMIRPSRSGMPTLSDNSLGAAPVPPSAPSMTMKSRWMPLASIALVTANNSCG